MTRVESVTSPGVEMPHHMEGFRRVLKNFARGVESSQTIDIDSDNAHLDEVAMTGQELIDTKVAELTEVVKECRRYSEQTAGLLPTFSSKRRGKITFKCPVPDTMKTEDFKDVYHLFFYNTNGAFIRIFGSETGTQESGNLEHPDPEISIHEARSWLSDEFLLDKLIEQKKTGIAIVNSSAVIEEAWREVGDTHPTDLTQVNYAEIIQKFIDFFSPYVDGLKRQFELYEKFIEQTAITMEETQDKIEALANTTYTLSSVGASALDSEHKNVKLYQLLILLERSDKSLDTIMPSVQAAEVSEKLDELRLWRDGQTLLFPLPAKIQQIHEELGVVNDGKFDSRLNETAYWNFDWNHL